MHVRLFILLARFWLRRGSRELFKPEETAEAASFANELIERYIAVGFGALSKREVDLLIIDLLETHLSGFSKMSDFDAARRLRTTKRKIRGLRDDVSYRTLQSDEQLASALRRELNNAEIIPADDWMVKVQIEDAVLRNFAEGVVRADYGLVDTSFNSTILKFSPEKFLFLAFKVLPEDELAELEEALHEIITEKKSYSASGEGSRFEKFKNAFLDGAGKEAGKLTTAAAFAILSGGASIVLGSDTPSKHIGKGIAQALKAVWRHFTSSDQGVDAAKT